VGEADADLAQMAATAQSSRLLARTRQRRQQHAGEHGNNGYYGDELDDGERAPSVS